MKLHNWGNEMVQHYFPLPSTTFTSTLYLPHLPHQLLLHHLPFNPPLPSPTFPFTRPSSNFPSPTSPFTHLTLHPPLLQRPFTHLPLHPSSSPPTPPPVSLHPLPPKPTFLSTNSTSTNSFSTNSSVIGHKSRATPRVVGNWNPTPEARRYTSVPPLHPTPGSDPEKLAISRLCCFGGLWPILLLVGRVGRYMSPPYSTKGDNKQTTGDNKQTTGDNKQTTGDNKQTKGDNKQTTGDNKQTGVGNKQTTEINRQ
ncbi:hypothetical protein Pcinc_032353 [Petrolisthes cinctipes]|uniref:Uncharacterized protein n=1 Tax=Petrolisthes cinctipes TaxID=88211 RepID=A0AAE1EUS0_PETCI|nr:hypothetical protein Pcinc_032353 [Petrolisthes cinctipes]